MQEDGIPEHREKVQSESRQRDRRGGWRLQGDGMESTAWSHCSLTRAQTGGKIGTTIALPDSYRPQPPTRNKNVGAP